MESWITRDNRINLTYIYVLNEKRMYFSRNESEMCIISWGREHFRDFQANALDVYLIRFHSFGHTNSFEFN